MRQALRSVPLRLAVLVAVLALPACLVTPGDTSHIVFVSSSTVNGWKYDYYRNDAYPCSISGHQTFVIGTKVGSSSTAPAPLYVWLHGGGIGWFDTNGTPQPSTDNMTEEAASGLQASLSNGGLLPLIRNDAAGFRVLAVSYCNRDIYSGADVVDPNNPNLDNGKPKATNGLVATKAAVAFAEATYPTTKYFLSGGSAGSVGSYEVAWAEQVDGNPPAGVVADASILNVEAGGAANAQGACINPAYAGAGSIIAQRVTPEIANGYNEPDLLVSRGDLRVPLLNIWNHGDVNTCGSTPMQCPLRDGSVVTMGVTDCFHEPMRLAINATSATTHSMNLPLCVDSDSTPDCSLHVVTTHPSLINTDPASPANYLAAIMTWVDARLTDP